MIISQSLGYILPLADPEATLEAVGGKGASLARLVTAGLPVPDGFHVTTAAYRQIVIENGLQPHILAALAEADAAQPATLEKASQTIRELFTQADFPEEIAAAIAQAYMDLSGDEPFVAVRSSATAEDLPEASFAGQQETFLNVQGVTAVLEAVRRCWASLWTARAISYRARQAIAPDQVSLAVVVQLLVPADAAGILFTVNPVNGRRQEAVMSAAWGLGEAVVGGLVTPDSLTVEKGTRRVLDRQTADKQTMTVRVAGGTEERPVPDGLRQAPVLSDQQAAELVSLGVQIEEQYGRPMDIEWTLQDGNFAIVQARPVTALPEEAPVSTKPVTWHVPDRGPYLHGGAFLEVLTEPVSTLFATLGLKSSDAAMYEWLERYRLGDLMIYPLAQAINGYIYARVRYRLRPKHFPPYIGLIREHMRAIDVWWQEVARYREFAKEAEKVDLGSLSISELCCRIEMLNKEATIYWLFVGEVIRPVISREEKFTKYYKRLARPGEDPEAQVLFRGGETLALQADRTLYELAELAQLLPDVANALANTPGDALQILESLPDGATFLSAFNRYLDKYGYQMYSFDPLLPTLGEDPQPALLALQSYLQGQESPEARHERMTQEKAQTHARLKARLPMRKYNRLSYLLRKAQEAAQIREDAVFEIGLAWRPLRHTLLELGSRLAEAEIITNAEQLFWLRWDEILAAAADMDGGKTPESLNVLAEERHAEWQTWQDLQPPYVLPEDGKMPFWLKFVTPLPELQDQTVDTLTGFAASPGKITAVARVIQSPAEMDRLGQGEILIARTTTPAWTPIFARIAAVVTDLGGALSHSSIVAREYGIPAVTGTGFATQRISDGQTITVDGTGGKVLLSTSGAPDVGQERPNDWSLPDNKGQYLRGSAAELLPDPMSPLFETMGVAALDRGTRQLFASITGLPLDQVANVIYAINGYAFMSAKFSGKQWFLMLTRGTPAIFKLIKNGEAHWREEVHPKYAAALERWQAQQIAEMTTADLWAGARELTRFGMETYNSLQAGIIPASTTSETVFTKVFEKLLQREGDPSALTFILGFNSMPIRAEKSLYDIGTWIGQQPALAAYVQRNSAAEMAAVLAKTEPPTAVSSKIWTSFREQFNSHLTQYGHTIYDLDFLKPTPANEPAPLLETLKVYVNGQGSNPHKRQAALAEKREAAMGTIRAQYRRGVRRWLFEKTVGWAQKTIPLREEGLADLGLGWPQLQQMLLEIGRRGVEVGFIQQANDIFWLREDEVETAVTALDRSEKLDSLQTAITERKALWQARKQIIPPSILPPKSKYLGIDIEKWMPARIDQTDEDKIIGVGASPGRITGTARVLHGPEDFGQMQPGDILVAAITTPAWTPLFALATAVVTDVGGPLSHSSIVAREYGIPAVLGTGVATKRIHSGQIITVDGAAGAVLLTNGNLGD